MEDFYTEPCPSKLCQEEMKDYGVVTEMEACPGM